jgi:SNF2 family DNA or RNA helicase
MDTSNKLQLTFIPFGYWKELFSSFQLIDNKDPLPKNVDFFLFWINSKESEEILNDEIQTSFPKIPVNKLRTCKIRLAFPFDEKIFEIKHVVGKIAPMVPLVKLLFQLQIIEDVDRTSKHYSNSIKIYAYLTKFLFELLNRGNFVPVLESYNENQFKGKWRLLLKTQEDSDRFNAILKNCPWSVYNLPANSIVEKKRGKNTEVYIADGLWHPSFLLSNYLDVAGDLIIRNTLNNVNFQTFKQIYSTEHEKENDPDYNTSWDFKFLRSLINDNADFQITRFHENITPIIIRNWSQITQDFILKHGFSFVLELNYPQELEQLWPLRFFILFQNNVKIPLNELWTEHYKSLEKIENFIVNKEYFLEIILRALGTASKIFQPIRQALEKEIPNEIQLTSSEVIDFLKYPKDLLIQNGFNIILPEVFTHGAKQRLTARLIIRSKEDKKVKGKSVALPSFFNINSILEYKWETSLKGEPLTEDEFKELIEKQEPLINWRGEWVLIDQQDVADLRNLLEKNQTSGPKGYLDALKLGLTGNIQLQDHGTKYNVILEGDFSNFIERIRSIDHFEPIQCPESFKGNLRPYQQKGLIWMGNMCKFNFGLCLADDMGLGKTIQVIALLLYFKENFPEEIGSILIICPMSLMFNWQRELKRFAPDLEIILHHGADRFKDAKFISEFLKPYRIFLTSYGTIRNDIEFLETIPFSGIIVDESQNIKNYNAQQTQAIYRLQSKYRICLSGTPIENRLIELWTLFEFLNPGLLGPKIDFQKNFVYPIERFQDQDAIEKLKKILSPFILRRIKSDKSIISELPDKNEMKIFVKLSDNQVELYQEVVKDTLKNIGSIISNKMNVLNVLIKLKQICNHPYQYLKKNVPNFADNDTMEGFISQSQKLERLIEMIEEVISNGEKILIFTQFTQMGDLIYKLLQFKYKFNILYFHGKVPEKKRKEIVDEFQSNRIESSPIMILSLKAGGTGLNLTKGTTVVHFDRWYNPSVESQATDRAYRIGQTKQVNVYKFITLGTIEEKIDALLEEKKELTESILESKGESWISDLNIEDFKNLFTLTN